jgi:diguanylate cyclase (GGDEF)-like protein
MHCNAASQTLKILVVTEDRELQRQLSQFFELVGYQVLQAAEKTSALAALEAESPQIVLVDAELAASADWELCSHPTQRAAAAPFKFLLVEEPDESQLQDALEAGVDDFLIKPIAYGELLSRLRAAARVLEYDRRVQQQSRVDPLTGLLSHSALAGHLRRQLTEHPGVAPRVACVVLDVDFFGRVRRMHGAAAADSLLQAVAQELNRLRVGSEILGCLGADRFCAVLPGANETTGAQWAETAREALAAANFRLGDAACPMTVSCGVAGCEGAEHAEQLIQRAEQALHAAKSLGRNCVVEWAQREAGTDKLHAPEKLFERTSVRDVMTPCTVFLRPHEPVAEAIELLDRTHLDGIPVVDGKGKLLGICERASLAEVAEADDIRTVREAMTTDVKSFDEGESLSVLMQYFTAADGALVVVVSGGRPVGFVTCNSLVALSRPVKQGSLAADSQYSDTSEFLLVPDVRPLECEPAV